MNSIIVPGAPANTVTKYFVAKFKEHKNEINFEVTFETVII